MMIESYFVILWAIVFEVFGQLCLKRAAISSRVSASDGPVRLFLLGIVRSRWTFAGIAAYVVELFLWIAALHFVPLSQAFPLMSLTYCGVAIASRLFLRERVSVQSATGIALITLGAMCVIGATV